MQFHRQVQLVGKAQCICYKIFDCYTVLKYSIIQSHESAWRDYNHLYKSEGMAIPSINEAGNKIYSYVFSSVLAPLQIELKAKLQISWNSWNKTTNIVLGYSYFEFAQWFAYPKQPISYVATYIVYKLQVYIPKLVYHDSNYNSSILNSSDYLIMQNVCGIHNLLTYYQLC